MEFERKFLTLLSKAPDNLPYIQKFKRSRYLRRQLYFNYRYKDDTYMYIECVSEVNVFAILNSIRNDFNKLVSETKPDLMAQWFADKMIFNLESIGIYSLTSMVIRDFLDEKGFIVNSVEYTKELKSNIDELLTKYLLELIQSHKELTNRFSKLGYLNHLKIIHDLKPISSIAERLNYLRDIKERYYDKYENLKRELSDKEKVFITMYERIIAECVFSNDIFSTTLAMPKQVFDVYFKKDEDNPEYTYWMLKFTAEQYFSWHVNSMDFKNKLASNLRRVYLEADLKVINEVEDEAKNQLLNKKINIYHQYQDNVGFLWAYKSDLSLIEVLRVLDGNYYKTYPAYSIHPSAYHVQAYFNHILLKPYLEKLLKKCKKTCLSNNTDKPKIERENYSQKQIAIAFHFQKIPITIYNYKDILGRFSKTTSKKILSKRISGTGELVKLSGNKTTDTKHLKDLLEAKELLIGIKDEKATEGINTVISTFQERYSTHY